MSFKKSIVTGILLIAAVFLNGCKAEHSSNNSLKVGTISGPETELMVVAQKVAKDRYQLNIEIVPFTDFSMPNTALNDGSIDANVFQHAPYLVQTINARHYDLMAVGKTFIYPMGIYSHKIKSLNDLTDKAKVAIPNDPSNEARALLLLQKAGLIQLGTCDPQSATVACVTENVKHLVITPLKAPQLPRALQDVDIALINTNYAIPAGLSPARDSIFKEGSDSLYANLVVIKADNKDDPRIQQLVEALNSPEVLAAAEKIFHGEAIPAWKK